VGTSLFSEKNTPYVDVFYLEYFRELEMVVEFGWGMAALAYLYNVVFILSAYLIQMNTM